MDPPLAPAGAPPGVPGGGYRLVSRVRGNDTREDHRGAVVLLPYDPRGDADAKAASGGALCGCLCSLDPICGNAAY